ncbi:MAG: hypothetical protein AAF601_13730 [Pseudomonadota bacterium]
MSISVTASRKAVLLAMACAASLILSACQERRADRIAFDGVFFRSNSSKVDKQRDQFVVSVGPASLSLDGARAAGRHEAVRYCIENFGASDIAWSQGPDAEDGRLVLENDRLILRGTCTAF